MDVFAGVGPFAVPAARRGIVVYANDLNPASYEALKKNAALNKVQFGLKTYNLDGGAFLKQAFKDVLADRTARSGSAPPAAKKARTEGGASDRLVDHIVMNLPATAIDFLPSLSGVFNGLLPTAPVQADMPTVHCHCFEEVCDDAEQRVIQRTKASLGVDALEGEVKVHRVRSVAPNKDMFCISFSLPLAVALR